MNHIMISTYQAKQIILENTNVLSSAIIDIKNALGKVLSAAIVSPIDLPPFPQSSMDGYAFKFENLIHHSSLEVKHRIAAGDESEYMLHDGQAVRLFTGSPIPFGCDTVVMQEKTELKNGRLYIHDHNLIAGSNYRNKGSEIKAGAIALPKDTRIAPATIGFLASMGIGQVEVYRDPSVSILITGDELTALDQDLKFGKVYDSNSYTLNAAFNQSGIAHIAIKHIPDHIERLKECLQEAIKENDIVVLTGGVSVGDFDFVTQAAEAVGVQTIFHKIKQKPGKPMYCGQYKTRERIGLTAGEHKCLIFGLPGNPASALTCFYEYIEPTLKKMMGSKSAVQIIHAPITSFYKKPIGLTHFLKASFDGNKVTSLDAQESFRLKSFALTNALIIIDEDSTEVNIGQLVEVHLLP